MATIGTPKRPASSGGRGSSAPPSPGRKSSRRSAPRKKTLWYKIKTFFQFVTVLVLVAIVTAIVAIIAWFHSQPTSVNLSFDPPGITYIYSSDGTALAKLFVENRKSVTIDQIPKDLQDATIALEDRRFYTHKGFDFQGIGRAVYRDLITHDVKGEGGSTITQQLARNAGFEGLTREKSLQRKLKEIVVANQIEKSYTKQQILEMYLNQVNYGSGAYGVEAAADTYFGKHVKDLDLAQCALLAGLPNRPAHFNPYHDMSAAEAQRSIVLDRMLEERYITPTQCAAAKTEKIRLAAPKAPSQGSQIYHAPYFVNFVVDQIKQKYGNDFLLKGNLRIETSLNWQMQQAAEDALRNGIANVHGLGPTQGCLVALDPKTGEIKAMVGGIDYKQTQFNLVTQSRRQPGSSFKAVIYAAAIDSGIVTEKTRVFDGPRTYQLAGRSWTPQDDTGYSYRSVDLRTAMAYSINVPAVRVLETIGPDTAVRYAKRMGIHSHLDPVLSLALGSSPVTPLEMAGVYATIASGGNYPAPLPFTRLTDSSGKVIEDILPQVETQILSKDTVTQLDDMLRAVVTEPRGTGAGVNVVPEARGKTGTTQGHKDVWFIGYTPELVCAVWAGHPTYNKKTKVYSSQEMEGTAWGATVCAPIWRDFMLKAVPIFKDAMKKEAARYKSPAAPPKPASAPAPSSGTAQNADPPADTAASDTAASDTAAGGADTPKAKPADTDASATVTEDNTASDTNPSDGTTPPEGTVTVNVDDNTGLRAPAGAPHSHRENFAKGAQPTVMSPEYDGTNQSDIKSNIKQDDASRPPDMTTHVPDTPRRPHHKTPPPPDVQYVTVRINPDDGLLATKWCPEVIEKKFVKGQEPHRYSKMYGPPPGEQ